jgi:hypothetical protein
MEEILVIAFFVIISLVKRLAENQSEKRSQRVGPPDPEPKPSREPVPPAGTEELRTERPPFEPVNTPGPTRSSVPTREDAFERSASVPPQRVVSYEDSIESPKHREARPRKDRNNQKKRESLKIKPDRTQPVRPRPFDTQNDIRAVFYMMELIRPPVSLRADEQESGNPLHRPL